MRIRILPLPADEFILVADRLPQPATMALAEMQTRWFEEFRLKTGARAGICSTGDIDLDASAVTLSGDVAAIAQAATALADAGNLDAAAAADLSHEAMTTFGLVQRRDP